MKKLLTAVAATTIMMMPATASAQDGAAVTLVHGIPDATVDVTVGGAVVIDDFMPGSIANISSFAGETLRDLAVVDGTSGESIIGPVGEFEVPASGNWSVAAHLDASGNAVLTSFENNTAATAEGTARLTLRHTAEFGPADLVIGDQRPITSLVNGNSAELELPVGQLVDAQLAAMGDVPIAQIASVDLAANTNTIIYIVGSETDDTLDFVVQVISLDVPAAATTTTTTTTPSGSTTTTTTTTQPTPTAVNTGSPLDDSNGLALAAVALGAIAVAGGAFAARRRV